MNQQVRRFLGGAALLSACATACAATGDPDVGSGDDTGTVSDSGSYGDSTAAHDSASPGYDSGTTTDSATTHDTGSSTGDTGTSGVCTPSCTSDSECESSCPAAQSGGVNCCDTSSGVCFANTSSTCPASGGNDP